jgi:hypothetical protein
MKKLIPFLVLLAGATVAMAQGTVNFANSVAFATANPGPGPDRLVHDVGGAPLVGSDLAQPATFVAQLYYGANASSLAAHTAAAARFRPGTTGPGIWLGGTRTLTGFAPGQTVTLQIVAWDMRTGGTYETAGLRGASQTFTYQVPANGSPPPSYFMENFSGFSLVPEPSVIGLGLIGVGALFMLRRRK